MKTLMSAVIFSVLTFTSLASYAGPDDSCHFHGSKPAAESIIIQCANQRKVALVKNQKLDKSWSNVKQPSVIYVDGKNGKEWKVTFINPSAPDQTKTSLYMFFTPPGNFIAANYTGQ